jgi:hypothetical protein
VDDQKLKQYLKFDEADLQANQTGYLTEKQKVRFLKDDAYAKKWSLIGGLILLALTALGPLGILKTWLSQADMTFAFIFGGIWTLIWGVLTLRLLMRAFSKQEYKPAKIQGPARVVEAKSYFSNNRVSIHHELQIGGKRFMSAAQLGNVFQGEECIIFYVDHSIEHPYDKAYLHSSDDILSVEVLSKQPAL